MKGRTYRFMDAEPLYPFGFGLSYTTFNYNNLQVAKPILKKNESTEASLTVTNTGKYKSDEVVELYVMYEGANINDVPLYALKSFKRISLEPGASSIVKFNITPTMLQLVNEQGQYINPTGKYKISIGGSLPSKRRKH